MLEKQGVSHVTSGAELCPKVKELHLASNCLSQWHDVSRLDSLSWSNQFQSHQFQNSRPFADEQGVDCTPTFDISRPLSQRHTFCNLSFFSLLLPLFFSSCSGSQLHIYLLVCCSDMSDCLPLVISPLSSSLNPPFTMCTFSWLTILRIG